MKLRLRYGALALLALLAAVALTGGTLRLALLIAAMGVALWTALSLPRPPGQREPPEDEAGRNGSGAEGRGKFIVTEDDPEE